MESRAYKMHVRVFLSRYRKYETCGDCNAEHDSSPTRSRGASTTLSLPEFYGLAREEGARRFSRSPGVVASQADAGAALLWREALGRLRALDNVGLGYLSLDQNLSNAFREARRSASL